MKKKTPKNAILVFSIIVLIILSSVGTLGISSKSNIEDQEIDKTKKVKISVLSLKSTSLIEKSHGLSVKNNSFQNLIDNSLYNNFRLSNDTANEFYPSMVWSGYNGICAYEYQNDTDPYSRIRISTTTNYGKDWSTPLLLEYLQDEKGDYIFKNENLKSPCFTNQGVGWNNAFGTFINPDHTSYLYEIEIPEIGDLDELIVRKGDYTYLTYNKDYVGYLYNMEKPVVVGYPNGGYPWVIALISDANYTDDSGIPDMIDSPFFIYQEPGEPENRSIVFFPDIQNCANVSICNDKSSDPTDLIYGVCEKKNNTFTELLFFKGDPYIWYTEDKLPLNNHIINNSKNITNPKIYVQDKNVYIIGENETGEIVLFNSSNYGESETWSKPRSIIQNMPPFVDFTYTTERLNVSFKSESYDPDGNITSYLWEFGDGTNYIAEDAEDPPIHVYPNPATYTVKLTVTDNKNVSFIKSEAITVANTTPIANFNYTPDHPNIATNVTFNSTSEAYIGYTLDNFTWNFGDGSNLEYSKNVTHKYGKNGTYIVNLTVRDNNSKTDYIEKTIYVGLVAEFSYSPIKPEVGKEILFNSESKVPINHNIVSYSWDFGDGVISADENPKHTYTKAGYYNIKLTIKDNNNTIVSKTHQIMITPIDYTPRFPDISGNSGEITVSYTAKSNIFITTSNNNGNSWESPIIINNIKYSVNQGYRFSNNIKNSHIVWTDTRDNNSNIYYISRSTPVADIKLKPGSIDFDKELFVSRNIIKFTVINNGEIGVSNVRSKITVFFDDPNNRYPPLEKEFISVGDLPPYKKEYHCQEILFKVGGELTHIRSMIDFAGVKEIRVTIDPYNETKDIDDADNTLSITNDGFFKFNLYRHLFGPKGWLQPLFRLIKLIESFLGTQII